MTYFSLQEVMARAASSDGVVRCLAALNGRFLIGLMYYFAVSMREIISVITNRRAGAGRLCMPTVQGQTAGTS